MTKEKICKYCEHSYDIDSEKKVRCVYHDKYPKPSDCCDDWKERSDELINRQMAKQAVADAESILLAFAMVGHLPAFEPNLILPERVERGEVYDVGETITVMNHEDYMDMMCEAMMWGEYGGEPKIDIVRCKECKHYKPYLLQFSYEPRGDGYCGKERITSEGSAFINCEDEYFCPYGERLEE